MNDYKIDKDEFTSTSEWSVSNALHMMKLCYEAYAGSADSFGQKEDWPNTIKTVTGAGYKIRKLERNENQKTKRLYDPNAMFCWDDDNIFLIFRGTEPGSWRQWATDARLIRRPFCIGKIHQGFKESVEIIWGDIKKCLEDEFVGKSRKLFVGGHSLGAGMSQVAVSKLEFEMNIRPTAIYNFGCPRAFNENGAAKYNEVLKARTFRVVNNDDLVCNIPFRWMKYFHVGRRQYITSNGELKEQPERKRLWVDGRMGLLRVFERIISFDFITDHLPRDYLMRITQVNNKEKI